MRTLDLAGLDQPCVLPDLPRGERTAQVYADALTPQTRTSYENRWNLFGARANENGFDALPAPSGTVTPYFQPPADGEYRVAVSTLRGRLAAVNRALRGWLPLAGSDPAMAAFVLGLVRMMSPGTRRDPVRALRVADIRALSRSMPTHDVRMIRDHAILTLHASGVSGEGIARLQWSDVIVRPTSAKCPEPRQTCSSCGASGVVPERCFTNPRGP